MSTSTEALDRTRAGSMTVADRRRAALERLHGGAGRIPARRPSESTHDRARRAGALLGRPARPGAGRLLRDRHRRRRLRHARPRHGAVGVGRRAGGQGQQPVPHLQPAGDRGRRSGCRVGRRHAPAPRVGAPAGRPAARAGGGRDGAAVRARRRRHGQRRQGVGRRRRLHPAAVGVPQAGRRAVRADLLARREARADRRPPQPAAADRSWPSWPPPPASPRATSARRS